MIEDVQRHMSRRIEVIDADGRLSVYPLSIVTLSRGGYGITPYTAEIAGVIYHDRPLRLTVSPTTGLPTLIEM